MAPSKGCILSSSKTSAFAVSKRLVSLDPFKKMISSSGIFDSPDESAHGEYLPMELDIVQEAQEFVNHQQGTH